MGVTECTAPRLTNDRMPTVVSLGLKTLDAKAIWSVRRADVRALRLAVLHAFGEKRSKHVALIVVRYRAVESRRGQCCFSE